MSNSSLTTSIHILDDYSLLNIFYLYRPFLLGEDEEEEVRAMGGSREWTGEHWWFKLTHVCQRWRNLILGAASYLGLCLACTYGTPLADMLARSPPLPLVIDYEDGDDADMFTAEDEEAIILALAQRDRVRRIRLYLPALKLQKLIVAMEGEYPILEYLILMDPHAEKGTVLILPETLETPHLRHLMIGCSIPIRSPLLVTAAGLVNLYLALHHPSTYFEPTVLLQSLSMMPQLEILAIAFRFAVPNRDVERQLMRTPIMTHVTLPNLRAFGLKAVSAYSEAVLSRITAPRLEDFGVGYPKQLTFSVPQLLQFMGRTENFRFDRAKFEFGSEQVNVKVSPPETEMSITAFAIEVGCLHLDWQVSSVAQIFNALSQMFSTVEHLTFLHEAHSRSSEEHNEVDRTEWRKLLRSFSTVKILRIEDGLVKELSRCFRLEDEEDPLEVLPELQELTCSGSSNTNDAFTSFIDTRRNADRPVTLKSEPGEFLRFNIFCVLIISPSIVPEFISASDDDSDYGDSDYNDTDDILEPQDYPLAPPEEQDDDGDN